MAANPRAGKPAQPEDLIDLPHLVTAYYTVQPDPDDVAQQVAFGTSGHRGSSLDGAFNEAHILATTQAIAEYRAAQGTTGPLFIGRDTHGLSEPAWVSALEVLAANDVVVMIDSADRYTPTPAVSHAILAYNRGRSSRSGRRDRRHPVAQPAPRRRVQVQPAQRRPGRHRRHRRDRQARQRDSARRAQGREAGAAGPGARSALSATTTWTPTSPTCPTSSTSTPSAPRASGSAPTRWAGPASTTGARSPNGTTSNLTVVNPLVDATWRFMTLDTDGKIRMDCSSPNAMASLIANRESYQIATGNDADADRHGIVTPDGGLMNPNHYLAVAIDYLYTHRPDWPAGVAVGKTAVSSSIIDRVVAGLGRKLVEVPVGFKWFVDGLISGTIGFGGEESAGASFLRKRRFGVDHRQGRHHPGAAGLGDPGRHRTVALAALRRAGRQYGAPVYARVDAPADREQKARLAKLSPEQVTATELAGEPITAKLTAAPGNGAAAGRAEGHHRQRLVRRAPVGHRGRLQDLRRVV